MCIRDRDEAGSVKVAIAMQKLGLGKDEAEAKLKAAKGSLRVALGTGLASGIRGTA